MAEDLVPIFRVRDGRATAAWYARLGFEVIGEHRFTPELPLYLFLRRGDVRAPPLGGLSLCRRCGRDRRRAG
jgi:hypothetical protein